MCLCPDFPLQIKTPSLPGVAQWIEHQPAKRKVTGSIPSQGTCLGCGPGPQEGVCERQLTAVSLAHRRFSLSLSLFSLSPSLPLSLKINK